MSISISTEDFSPLLFQIICVNLYWSIFTALSPISLFKILVNLSYRKKIKITQCPFVTVTGFNMTCEFSFWFLQPRAKALFYEGLSVTHLTSQVTPPDSPSTKWGRKISVCLATLASVVVPLTSAVQHWVCALMRQKLTFLWGKIIDMIWSEYVSWKLFQDVISVHGFTPEDAA